MKKTIAITCAVIIMAGCVCNAHAASINQQIKMQRTRIKREGLLGIAGVTMSKSLRQDRRALRSSTIGTIVKKQEFIGQKIKLVKFETGDRARKFESRNTNRNSRSYSGDGNWLTQHRPNGNFLVDKGVLNMLSKIDYAKANMRVPGRI